MYKPHDSIPGSLGYSWGRVFVSPELSSVRDYVITHSVRSMYVVRVCVCMYVRMYVYVCGIFATLITVSTYIDVFPRDLETMILG